MLCERCGIREATVNLVQEINGHREEHHFCSECIADMSMEAMNMLNDENNPLGRLMKEMTTQMGQGGNPIGDMVTGMMGGVNLDHQPKVSAEMENVVCPGCGTSYKESIEKSRFGCATCYDVFGPLMDESIKDMHAGEGHTGKVPMYGWQAPSAEEELTAEEEPKQLSPKEEVRLLENSLSDALAREDYENAAIFRDRIRELKVQMEDEA